MQVTKIDDTQLFDMFQSPSNDGNAVAQQAINSAFGLSASEDVDIFKADDQQQQQQANTGDQSDGGEEGGQKKEGEEGDDNQDLFQYEEDLKKQGRKPKYNFQDASGYFEDRIKAGRFVAVNEVDKDGKEIPFIPKTPEEFDEFIDINLNHKFEEKAKELEEGWLQTKSPAFQYLAEISDKIQDVSELLPFIEGIKKIDSVASYNENEIDGAEKIYRTWLGSRGEPAEAIERQVEMAKTSNQLVDFAKTYKPLIIQREQQVLAETDKAISDRDLLFKQQIYENERKAIEAIESPIFGKQKLKDDEKVAVYSLIGKPVKELGGYPIYTEIDKLFAKKDFQTLRELSLLLAKRDNYLKYAAVPTAQAVAGGLQRTLKVATEGSKNGGQEEGQQMQQQQQRQQAAQRPLRNNGFTRA